jgi:hypothetical protein
MSGGWVGFVVPRAGVEPARGQASRDFKSEKDTSIKPVISVNYAVSLAFFVPKMLENIG